MSSMGGRGWIAALVGLAVAVVLALLWLIPGRVVSVSTSSTTALAPSATARAVEPTATSTPVEAITTPTELRERLAVATEAVEQPSGLFLRLVESDGRTPLAKHAAVILRPSADGPALPMLLVQSDADGLVDIAPNLANQPEPTRLVVQPNDFRVRFEPRELVFAELGRTPSRAPVLRRVERSAGTLRGRALERESGAPIAGLALHIEQWGEAPPKPGEVSPWVCLPTLDDAPWMVTDDEGRFASAQPVPFGMVWLATPHRERSEGVLHAENGEVEARFLVGPRILLAFEPPGERAVTDFVAGLYRAPEEAGLAEEIVDPASPWTPEGWDPLWYSGSAVHAGTPAWARLGADALAHPLPSFLILFSRDGAAKGVARIDEFARHAREPLFVDVREVGALAGTVRAEDDEEQRECRLELYATPERDAEPIGYRYLQMPGSFVFQGLEPGRYRLQLSSELVEPASLELDVPAAAPLALVLAAPDRDELNALLGRIRTESGRPLDGRGNAFIGNVWCRAEDGSSSGSARVDWSDGTGTFRVEDLAAGRYRVEPMFSIGGFSWEPMPAMVDVPGGELELLVRDGGEHQRVELCIVEPPRQVEIRIEGHSELPGMHISRWMRAGDELEQLPDGRSIQRIEFGPFPAGAIMGFTIGCEGMREALVTPSDFFVTGDLWRAEVRLVPGWKATFSVSDEAREGLASIVLALDGRLLAPTDESGHTEVELDAKPQRLSVVTPGWELVEHYSWSDWGTVFPTGEFTLEDGHLDVFLRRAR
jgi:hypothetical protein